MAIQLGRILNETGARTIYQVGDFGLFPHGVRKNRRLGTIHRRLEEADATMYIVPGNHEDWGWMKYWMEDEPTSVPSFPRFVVLPRVWRWEINGTKFLSVSGGNSIDFKYRTEGKTWWPEEQITDDMVKEAQRGGKAEQAFLHRGIAARHFQRTFVLAEGMHVLGADLKNGLLSIDLVRREPQRLVRKIDIRNDAPQG